jgi:hypothetical protein
VASRQQVGGRQIVDYSTQQQQEEPAIQHDCLKQASWGTHDPLTSASSTHTTGRCPARPHQ